MSKEHLSTNEQFIKTNNPLIILLLSIKIAKRLDYAADQLPLLIETAKEREMFLKKYTKELETRG